PRGLHVCGHTVEQTMCGVDRGYFAFRRGAHFGSEMIESFTRAHLIQFELASQQRRAGKMFEYYVRVSNCRQTRPAIASRTWFGSCGFRAHAQRAAFVDSRNRSAAGADSMNVQHRNSDGDASDNRFV